MSEKEMKAIDMIAESVKQMNDAGKAEFIAFAEGFAQGVKFSAEKNAE